MRRMALCLAMLAIAAVTLTWSNPILASTYDKPVSIPSELVITNTFTPVADAWVDSSLPTSNYGTSTQIRVDGSPTLRGYVRFSVAGLSGTVSRATLRVYANSSITSGYTANRVADNTWSETGITYSNAPAVGTAINTSAVVAAATWTTIDVTSYVAGNGTFSFALTSTNATALSLASREAANAPQLVVETNSPTPTATSPAPTATSAAPTATSVAPTATSIAPTATSIAPTATSAPSGGTLTFNSAADAWVDSSLPTSNYGTSTQIRVDGSPTLRGYVRFNVSGLSGAVSKATLRIYANSSLTSGYTAARVADNTWSETGITYNNAPAVGAAINTSAVVAAATWTTIDVTSYVTGNGTYSFALTSTNATALSLASREAANQPQLVVTTGSGTLPTPTPTSIAVSTPTSVAPTATQVPPTATSTPSSGSDPVILLTGDSRTGCDAGGTAVAKLLDTLPTSWPLLFNGDATSTGAYTEFTTCFDTTYGRHKAQIKPVPGNHEYMTSGGSGYFQYYGSQAGTSGKGYYSFNVGTWHIVALNTEIEHAAGGTQETWLKNDLAANPTQCTLAFWHEPRWSSGEHGNNTDMGALWTDLYNAGAEIVMNGHDHDYERFAPQSPSGALDNTRGIREWVMGTGGVALRPWGTTKTNSQVRNNTTWGLLKLTLHPSSYDWQFLPVAGQSLSDSGSTACH